MKTYKITITSNQNKSVSEVHFFVTSLPKGFLMDIIRPLTNYQILIEEFDKQLAIALSVEGILNIIKDIKLKTKIAKNVTEVTKGNISDFVKKPNFDLNVWHGNNGEIRTYINNMSFPQIERVFPETFKLDIKSYKPYFEGELELIQLENKVWRLCFTKIKHKVIYEEITLES